MDVDKLRKINMLANTLRQHGIAADRQVAVEIAGRINGTTEEVRFTDIVQQPEPKQVMIKEEEPKMEKQGLSETQIINVLQSFADQFGAEVSKLKSRIDEQDRQIKQLSMLRAQQGSMTVSNQPMQNVEVSGGQQQMLQQQMQQPVQQVQQVQQRPQQQNPRSGGFNSADVAIDKIFYFGNK